jgi:hypothetical protein
MMMNAHPKTSYRTSICFISNRTISIEACLFSTAFCRRNIFNTFCLNTRCATKADLIAYNEWKALARPMRLILSKNKLDKKTVQQKKVIDDVKLSNGTVEYSSYEKPVQDADLIAQINLSDYIVVIEINCEHPLLDRNKFDLTPHNTAVFQWAIPKPCNQGCLTLFQSGRGTPLYPAFRDKQLDAFLSGKKAQSNILKQPELGL